MEAGFEPAVRLLVRQFSKLVVSATHPLHLNLLFKELERKFKNSKRSATEIGDFFFRFFYYSSYKDKTKSSNSYELNSYKVPIVNLKLLFLLSHLLFHHLNRVKLEYLDLSRRLNGFLNDL